MFSSAKLLRFDFACYNFLVRLLKEPEENSWNKQKAISGETLKEQSHTFFSIHFIRCPQTGKEENKILNLSLYSLSNIIDTYHQLSQVVTPSLIRQRSYLAWVLN